MAVLVVLACGPSADADDRGDGEDVETDGEEDADATDGGVCAPEQLVVTVDQAVVSLDYWTGDPLDVVSVLVERSDPQCALSVVASVPWLAAEFTDAGGGAIALQVVSEELVSGVHAAEVEILAADGARKASIAVELRALVQPGGGGTRRVVVIGVDGLLPDAIDALEVPTLRMLIDRGASSLSAQTQLTTDTKSGPGWASILCGVEASKHLVDANDDLADIDRTYPTMLARAQAEGLSVASVGNWPGIATLLEDDVPKASHFGQEQTVADEARARIDEGVALIFLQFDSVDLNGHIHGFSPEIGPYATAVENVDRLAGEILEHVLARPEVAMEDWLFVLTTDHAGLDKDHGPQEPVYQTIPLSFAGPGVTRGDIGAAGASHLDVAPTVLDFFGIELDAAWGLDGQSRW